MHISNKWTSSYTGELDRRRREGRNLTRQYSLDDNDRMRAILNQLSSTPERAYSNR